MESSVLQPLLESGIAKYAVPGAQVGLLRGAERVVVSAGVCDQRDNRPVVDSTAFHAGSIAKALTGLVILDAARNGDLDLDAPCAAQGEGLWPETPRTLLSQTSGRPNLLPENDEPIEDFVERVAALPLVHAPGRFSYCNAAGPCSTCCCGVRRDAPSSRPPPTPSVTRPRSGCRPGQPADTSPCPDRTPCRCPRRTPPPRLPPARSGGRRRTSCSTSRRSTSAAAAGCSPRTT